MQLKDIMVKEPVTVGPEESVAVAAGKMRTANVGCLVVTNAGAVKGILTDRDLAVHCVSEGHDPKQCRVSGHMSAPVISADSSQDILGAAEQMRKSQVKRLPIMEGGRLTGIVSYADIAQALAQPLQNLLVGMGSARRVALERPSTRRAV